MTAAPTFFATEAEFRAWLEAHHETAPELLVGFRKKASGKPSIDWPQARDQALCFGWIDGVRKSLGEESYTIRFTPRRKGSIWSDVNVARYEALTAAGQMTEAGVRALRRRRARRGVYAYENAQAELTGAETALVPRQQGGLGRLGEAPARLPQGRAPLGHQREKARDPRAPPRHLDRGQRGRPKDRRGRHRPQARLGGWPNPIRFG